MHPFPSTFTPSLQLSNSNPPFPFQEPPPPSLPRRPSLPQIKQLHARLITTPHFPNKAKSLSRLIAALAILPSPISPSTSALCSYVISLFQTIDRPCAFATNNMIRCLGKCGSPRDGLKLYRSMRGVVGVEANKYTYPFVLQACSLGGFREEGVQVHGDIVKLGFNEDVFIRNSLIHFYTACREINKSRMVFDESEVKDVVTCNAMITGYAREGEIDLMREVFDEMPMRDVISWSTMMMGYVQGGELEMGLKCFKEIWEKGLEVNEAILVTVLSACAQLGLLKEGEYVHDSIKELKFRMSVNIGTGLVDMYAKCGCIERSKRVFNEMPKKDVWSWNVMIIGLAVHGLGLEAISLFKRFLREGLCPVKVTFIGVLNACSRARLVDDGKYYFKMMKEVYGLEPEMEHYGCMVDVLGRAGLVSEALELIEEMKIKPGSVVWGTLLSACKIHGLVELGEIIGEKLIEANPTHDGNYVLLGNIYAKSMKWEDVIRVRRLMVHRGANKVAGWSLVEAGGKTHNFVASDREHDRSSEIYKKLNEIENRLLSTGYSPDISPVLQDIGDEEKEIVIRQHSERLAISFAFLVTEAGSCIRIVKNLRFCGDCHEIFKLISKIYEREIIVRDGSRFHRFIGGMCSCLDYW